MAQTTTNYSLLKPEASDTYNHLVYDNPNMDTIDSAMKDNANHGVDSATCIKSGTVHSVTRSNTSCPVFKFTATGDWNTGDTMDVDGTPVSVYLPNGTAPLTGCYVINTEVMAIIAGSRVTLLCPVIPDATQIAFDPTGTTLTATNVESALQELNNAANVMVDSTHSVTNMFTSTTEQIDTGIYMKRCGNIRILRVDVANISSSVITTLAVGDRPSMNVSATGRWKDTSDRFYPSIISVLNNGQVSASAFIPNTTTNLGINNGSLVAECVYFV